MKSISYIDDEVGTYNGAADLVFPHPSDAAERDTIIAACYCTTGGGGPSPTPPAGWVELATDGLVNCGTIWFYLYRVPASPPANYTWVLAGFGELIGVLSVYRAGDVEKGLAADRDTSETDHDAPALDIRRVTSWMICAWGSPSANTWTEPSGMTERHDRQTSVATNASLSMADEAITSVGTTGVKTAVMSGAAKACAASVELTIPELQVEEFIPEDPPGGIGL
jgi:hypothetical protein